jgi:hypothetical protein
MRLWRWLLIVLIAPTVFTAVAATTLIGGGAVTGLAGVQLPFVVLGLALVAGSVAVYKSGGMILD